MQDRIISVVGKGHILEGKIQRLSRDFNARTIQHFWLEITELVEALYAGTDSLEALDLMGHCPKRFFEQIDVMDEEVNCANRDQPGSVEPVTTRDREQRTDRECQAHCIFDDPAFEVRPAVVREDDTLMSEKFLDRIIHCAARADVFGAGQLFLEKPIHLCFGLAARLLMRDRNIFQPAENEDGRERENSKPEPCTPIFQE